VTARISTGVSRFGDCPHDYVANFPVAQQCIVTHSNNGHVLRARKLATRLRGDQAVMARPDRCNRNGRRLCFVAIELGKPCVTGTHLRETSSDDSSGEHAAVVRRSDRNDPFDARRPTLPKIRPRD